MTTKEYRHDHQDEILRRHHRQLTQAPTSILLAEGALASMGAAVFSNPFEVMKTRLQLQGELMKRGEYVVQYRGMFHGMRKIAQQEGIFALQNGLTASLLHQAAQNGVRLGCFPLIQRGVSSLFVFMRSGAAEDVDAPASVVVNVTAGACAGMFGAAVSSPFYLVKTRLQTQSRVSQTASLVNAASGAESASAADRASSVGVGKQHNYRGVWDALTSIRRTQGIQGLFHGVGAAAQRTAVGSATQLATYDWCKYHTSRLMTWSDKDIRVHVVSSIAASATVVITMNPFDVLMTRRYNNDHAGKHSALAAFASVLKTEGIHGLYKGSVPLFTRQAPHFIATFVFLEQIRNYRMSYYKQHPPHQ